MNWELLSLHSIFKRVFFWWACFFLGESESHEGCNVFKRNAFECIAHRNANTFPLPSSKTNHNTGLNVSGSLNAPKKNCLWKDVWKTGCWREFCRVIWDGTEDSFDANVFFFPFFFFQLFSLHVLLLTTLDFLSIQLLLIDSNTHSHLGAAAFKLQPLQLVTDQLRWVLACCFGASQQQITGAKEELISSYRFIFFPPSTDVIYHSKPVSANIPHRRPVHGFIL